MIGLVRATPPPVQEPSSKKDIQAALSGGVPGDRWKEGLLFKDVKPMPWLKSAANRFPGTEEIQPEEMRVTFIGTSPSIRPGQMNTSILSSWDIKINEFDFRDNGGVVYEKNGAKVTHWQRSHAKDGASGYRLDWHDMCFVWTGDGHPASLISNTPKAVIFT